MISLCSLEYLLLLSDGWCVTAVSSCLHLLTDTSMSTSQHHTHCFVNLSISSIV